MYISVISCTRASAVVALLLVVIATRASGTPVGPSGSSAYSANTEQNLYVTDAGSGSVLEFSSTGAVSTFARIENRFNLAPFGLAFDDAGNLFVGSAAPKARILKFNPGKGRSTFASGLRNVSGLAFDSAGNLFASDLGNSRIVTFNPAGAVSTFASGLDHPYGLAFDSSGNLFEADLDSGRILEFSSGGAESVFASGLGFAGPAGLAFDTVGNLFVTVSHGANGEILEFTPDGAQSIFASGLRIPLGLAFDNAGNLFESDSGTGRILEFTPTGVETVFASGLKDPAFIAFGPASPVPDNGTSILLLGISALSLFWAHAKHQSTR
jgi:DNA-binding beta-propeller fold protein YncE